MRKSEKIGLAQKAYDALGREDWDLLGEILAPGFVLQRAGGMGTVDGVAATKKFREPEAFDFQHDEPDGEFIEHGERMFAGIRSRARGAESAIEIEQPAFHVITFRDQKVTRLEIYFDRDEALAALKGD